MENIKKILKDIEERKKIRILYASETGSRAWGFPSPDSDYDVRFIYCHERDWYLSLAQKKDSIEVPLSEDLDVTGWDLKKSLLLLKRSNPPLIERFQSPIEYYSNPGFKSEFKELIQAFYSPTAVFYHHYSLAKKFWVGIVDQEKFRLKDFFYLVRSLLSCNWLIKDNSLLPMDIEGLMKYIDANRRKDLERLIQLKSNVGEKYLHEKDEAMNEWIKELFYSLENEKNNLGVNRNDLTLLNEFFLKTINGKVDVIPGQI